MVSEAMLPRTAVREVEQRLTAAGCPDADFDARELYRLFIRIHTGAVLLRRRGSYSHDAMGKNLYYNMHFVLYSPQYDFYFPQYHAGLWLWIFAYDGRRGRAGGKNAGGNDCHESPQLCTFLLL